MRRLILDGEIVTLDDGRPSFERLQGRMHLASEAAVRRRMREIPATYMAFDLLWLDGASLMELPYAERREQLEELGLRGSHWQTPAYHRGDGEALLAASAERGLEGVVAKRLDSPYCPGKRTGYWLKIKNTSSQELVIGGWAPGEGRRRETLGALLVGYYDDGSLRYAGKVGTGYTEEALAKLMTLLRPLVRDESAFDGRQPPRGAIFVEPRLVAEVEFREWTRDGMLRAPSFKGLREDKDPREVVREVPV
jgi:bifunctional non-homologous end joining protein LigD